MEIILLTDHHEPPRFGCAAGQSCLPNPEPNHLSHHRPLRYQLDNVGHMQPYTTTQSTTLCYAQVLPLQYTP